MTSTVSNQHFKQRPLVLSLVKILFLLLGQTTSIQAIPVHISSILRIVEEEEGKPAGDPSLWIYLAVAAALVLLGGAFAGLTIALMGQDEIYLQVIEDSGEGAEKKNAGKVLRLLKRGKHWVLVTLLLSNVITNETLPIVLDRSLGGGWPAVLGSTVLIVIFGEIVPQSICVRYGLPIGAWMAPFVLALMYIMSPVAWPTAKLLDWLLGQDHGTMYKKAGLKTLVSLHRNLGESGQRLHSDEVKIISAVLDLKDKSIGSIMTPMDDVFTLSLDDVLDETTVGDILTQGYSRVPVHHPDNEENFVGMLLVKMLISYDPEDAKPVREFALATLPETKANTSCLDIINFFQEGKSHMVLVSESPGTDHGALGVVTLEDVIEELIGEEIVDESDVFVDVHKAIRRLQPAPRNRIPHTVVTAEEIQSEQTKATSGDLIEIREDEALQASDLQKLNTNEENAQKHKSHQRRPSGNSATTGGKTARLNANMEEAREHMKHIGPSNPASRPRTTRYSSIKIKPGAEQNSLSIKQPQQNGRMTPVRRISEVNSEFNTGIGEGLLKSAGKEASDGVQAIRQDYGTIPGSPDDRRPPSAHKAAQTEDSQPIANDNENKASRPKPRTNESEDTVGELPKPTRSRSPLAYNARGPARSGSITENIVDTNGIRKVVLETTSSSDSNGEDEGHSKKSSQPSPEIKHLEDRKDDGSAQTENGTSEAVKRRRRRRKRGGQSGKSGESQPLLEEHE